jgi:hypothetical protein
VQTASQYAFGRGVTARMLRSWPAPGQRHEPARRCYVGPCGKASSDSIARLEHAATTVARAREIKKRFPIVDQLARGREGLARWAGVHVTLLVEREVFPTEGPIVAL